MPSLALSSPASRFYTLTLEAQLQRHAQYHTLDADQLLDLEIAYLQARIPELEEEVRVLKRDLQSVKPEEEKELERDLNADEIEAERLKWVMINKRKRMTSEEREDGRKRVKVFLEGGEEEGVSEGVRRVLDAVESMARRA